MFLEMCIEYPLLLLVFSACYMHSFCYWKNEYGKCVVAYPAIFSWADPKFVLSFLRATIVQLGYVKLYDPDHVVRLTREIPKKNLVMQSAFDLHHYNANILVNQETNPKQQTLKHAAYVYMADRTKSQFHSDCIPIFEHLTEQAAKQGMPLHDTITEALFAHQNNVLFDNFEPPAHFNHKDMAEWIKFMNYDNVKDRLGTLQCNVPSSYNLPTWFPVVGKRNRHRNKMINIFQTVIEELYQYQLRLLTQGKPCLLQAAEDALERRSCCGRNKGIGPATSSRLTGDEAKAFLFGLYSAAMLTSISTCMSIVHLLAKHPTIQIELYDEIVRVVGEGGREGSEQSHLQYDHIAKLYKTRAFVKEMMRLLSPAFTVARSIGTVDIYLSLKSLNQNSHLWGDGDCSVDSMNLGRFLRSTLTRKAAKDDPNKKQVVSGVMDQVSHKRFIPFGVGNRSCPGRDYVQFEFTMMIVHLLKAYSHISYSHGGEEMMVSYEGLVTHILNPYKVDFEFCPRKTSGSTTYQDEAS